MYRRQNSLTMRANQFQIPEPTSIKAAWPKRMLALFSLCFFQSMANAVPPLPIEDFFRTEQYGSSDISPNGKYLAITKSVKDKSSLLIVNLETRDVQSLAAFIYEDITSFSWSSNNRLVICCDGSDEPNLIAINRDGTNLLKLKPSEIRVLLRYDDDSGNIVIAKREHNGDDIRAYKLDTNTGEKHEKPLHFSGLATDFFIDNAMEIRFAYSRNSLRSSVLWYRDSAADDWKKIAELDDIDPAFRLLRFDEDNRTLYVSSRAGGDKYGIYKYDLVKNKLGELVISDTNVDIDGGLVFKKNKLIGVRIQSDPPRTYWIDPAYAKAQEEIDATFPDLVNYLHGDIDGQILVYSRSATNPGKYGVYNPGTKKYFFLFDAKPWVKPDKLVDQLLFNYAARDGLDIPSYLTLPKGPPSKSLPLVVLVHNGPFKQDIWGYDQEVQFLANLGYAVLQPQYRGSTGHGWNHFTKGWKSWGLAMQDDLVDGVNNLVKQGLVDAARVCIMGDIGYGGYAALMGLVKDPDIYRCGIDMFGTADISMMTSAKQASWNESSYKEKIKDLIGDRSKLNEQFDATSPLKQAARIHAPVLILSRKINHRESRTIIQAHGKLMNDALKREGKDVEWLEFETPKKTKEKQEDRYTIYRAIEKFLLKYNPPD